MKKLLTFAIILICYLNPSIVLAQFDIVAKEGEAFKAPSDFCWCNVPEDHSQLTYLLSQLAQKELDEKFKEIEEIFKNEIESRTRQEYDNFEDAAKGLFKRISARNIANKALDNLYDEYVSNYANLKIDLREVQLEVDVLNIRKGELQNPTSKLGYLKIDEDTYLRDLTTDRQINTELNKINSKINELNISISTPAKIISGIEKLKKDDLFVDIIADKYFDDYKRYGYQDKIRLIQGYLIQESIDNSVNNPIFDPPLYQTDGSGEAYQEALALGESVVKPLELDENETIRRFAINSLGAATKSYLSDKPDLKEEVNLYLTNSVYAKSYLDCTYYLFDTYLGDQQFNANPILYKPEGQNFKQNAFAPNLAISFALTPYAISNGLEGFGNVLHEFFDNPYVNKDYEGKIIRDVFFRNLINTSSSITNEQLGTLFNFKKTESRDRMLIIFANDIGSSLYPQGIAIGSILLGGENLELAMLMAQGNQELNDFLAANNYSEDSVLFAKEAFEALANDGEVDFEDNIIETKEFENSKANCVFEKLKKRSGGFRNLLYPFLSTETISPPDLKFSIGAIQNTSTSTVNAITITPTNGVIEIKINSTGLEDRTELGLARTLIHETLHAHIYRQLLEALNRGDDINGLTSVELESMLERNLFPELFDVIKRNGLHSQHFAMAELYRGIIIEGLKAYDLGQHTDQFYSDLAWSGLSDSEDYREIPGNEEKRIEDVQEAYRLNGNKNCEE